MQFEKHFSFQNNQAVVCSHFRVSVYMSPQNSTNCNFREVCDILSVDHIQHFKNKQLSDIFCIIILNNFRCPLTKYSQDIP